MRTLKITEIADGLYMSQDRSVDLVISHRTWERAEYRWVAKWNTFMSGRVEHHGRTRAEAIRNLGATVRVVKAGK